MSSRKLVDLFRRKTCNVIGMLHVQALPGCPKNSLSVDQISTKTVDEAKIYIENGLDAIMIENMHDVPYAKGSFIGPEIIASMSRIATNLRQKFPDIPIGIQILTAANNHALAVAKCTDLDFIRAEGFVFSHVGDEGFIDSCAGPLLRYRKAISAENVLIFTDIKKKHSSHSITNDLSVEEVAKAAEFFLSDGVIITGKETGIETDIQQLKGVKKSTKLPVLVGSGVNIDNIDQYIDVNALIIGSHFKKHGYWENDVDKTRVSDFMKKVKEIRKSH